MSFDDVVSVSCQPIGEVSIPFEQGDVFRRKVARMVKGAVWSQSLSIRAMSFDIMSIKTLFSNTCLNPFRAGRCLSTENKYERSIW